MGGLVQAEAIARCQTSIYRKFKGEGKRQQRLGNSDNPEHTSLDCDPRLRISLIQTRTKKCKGLGEAGRMKRKMYISGKSDTDGRWFQIRHTASRKPRTESLSAKEKSFGTKFYTQLDLSTRSPICEGAQEFG